MSLRNRLAGVVGPSASEEAAEHDCQACGTPRVVAFYEVESVPAQTCVLLDSGEEAGAFPSSSLLLALCEQCGFIQNTRFDLGKVDYSKPTEESQAFSPRFTEFATELADDLVERHRLVGKDVLEIGCGKGDFLQLLSERGVASGLGIDPGYLPNRDLDGRIEVRRDWYGPEDSDQTADFILTRHLMEHIPNVGEFFGWLRRSTEKTEGSVLFTEVPDTARVLREGAFWDVYHEHCSYFTAGSLARTLRNAEMNVYRLEYGFDGQYLLAESRPGTPEGILGVEEAPEEIAHLVEQFAREATARLRHWRRRVEGIESSGGRVAIWGGGSKAVAFVGILGLDDVTVVDINPHKQGKWLPGTDRAVHHPRVLADLRPDLVIPMNPIYTDEIREDLSEMGLSPRVESA